MSRDTSRIDILEDEAIEQCSRLAGNLQQLKERLNPGELLAGGIDRVTELAQGQINRATDFTLDLAGTALEKGKGFVQNNKKAVAIGALATVGTVLCVRHLLTKKPVPIYEAYKMEDPRFLGGEGASHWRRLKANAGALGAKAEEAYSFARAAARDAADALREETEGAGSRLKEAAAAAGAQARTYQQESPAVTIAAGLVLGALAGILLPTGKKTADEVTDA